MTFQAVKDNREEGDNAEEGSSFDKNKQMTQQDKVTYWENLLQGDLKKKLECEEIELGKGKRIKKQVLQNQVPY